jgi:uncharacterized membrane protein
MLVWVRFFGTSLADDPGAVRLFGIGAVPLLFWLGVLVGDRTSGSLAAVLPAVNGFHIFFPNCENVRAVLSAGIAVDNSAAAGRETCRAGK